LVEGPKSVQTELLKKEFGVMNLGKIKDLEAGEAFRRPRPGYATD